MPLVRFEVRSEFGLGAGELYKEADSEEPKAILDGVAVAGLVGILRQLGDLAEFAAEVFHGLQEQVVTTASRSHKMLVRVQQIEATLPPLEKAVLAQKSHIHFSYTPGCMWHPKVRVKQKHFIRSDLPNFILDSYEECHDPPRLHLLDKFDTGGPGACLRRYSDPSFFRKSISRSEARSSEKVKREKRVRKSKTKSFRRRNGSLADTLSTSQCSSRMHYESPNITMGESIRMRSRSEQGEHSLSFDSRTRSDYIECVFEGNSSLQHDEDYNRSPMTSKIQDAGETDFVVPGEKISLDDNTTRESLQDLNASSVTWDEKTEILEPNGHQFDHIIKDEDVTLEPNGHQFDHIIRDEGVTLDSMLENCDLAKESIGITSPINIDPEDSICASPDGLESLSEVDEFDEAGSEPDKFADALNTLESETETDSEYQTKREVEKPFSISIIERMDTDEIPMMAQKSGLSSVEFGTVPYYASDKLLSLDYPNLDSSELAEIRMIGEKSEMSSVEFGTVPYTASNKQISLDNPNLDSSENLVSTQLHDVTAVPANPDISLDVQLSESTSVLEVLPADECRSSCSESSSSLASAPSSQPPACNENLCTSVDSQGSLQEISKVSSVNVWTNGGLLGLEPSKPPDFSMSNGKHHDSMISAENNGNGLSDSTVLPKFHPNGLGEVGSLVKIAEQTDKSPKSQAERDGLLDMVNSNNLNVDQPSTGSKTKNLASFHVKQGNELEHLSTLTEVGTENKRHSSESSSVNTAHGHALKQTGAVSSQGELPAVAGGNSVSRESNQQNIEYSLGMFGLGQRFRKNGILRKDSVQQPIIPEKTPKNQLRNDSPVNSHPPSPPLEHMKISFYPLDLFETTKLGLKFPGGHSFHESTKDVIFPSFQLLPEPAILGQDSGSESENDTFCRSSPYLSDEFLSRHSESSSEQWDSDDMYDRKDQEISDTLCRVSSLESTSSAFELDGVSNEDNNFNNGFNSSKGDSGVGNLHNNVLFDLPSFGSVSSMSSQQERKSDSATDNHQVSELNNEPVPPPPPLPPVQWRVTKPHLDVAKNEQDFTFEVDSHSNNLLIPEITTPPAKPDPPSHPYINDIANCILKSKQDQHSPAGNTKKLDEREDLLNQIRSKSFTLRPTIPIKSTPSESPTSNNKVAAILEKADAIRQAFVGNEDTGDETWSSDG